MKKFSISPENKGILFSLLLLPQGIMAAENLNFNYTRDSLSLPPRVSLQVKACHKLTDPIKIRFVVRDIDVRDDRVTLKINGLDLSGNIAPFKDKTTFIIPFKIDYTEETTQTVGFVVPGRPSKAPVYRYEQPYCFSNLFWSNSYGSIYGGRTFGYSPISVNNYLCETKVKTGIGYYFDYEQPLELIDDPVVYKVLRWKKSVDNEIRDFFEGQNFFFKKKILVSPGVKGVRDIDDKITYAPDSYKGTAGSIEKLMEPNDKKMPSNSKAINFIRVNGGINYDVSQRNITSIELKIVKKGGKENVFRWERSKNVNDEKTQNVLKIISPGTVISLPSADTLLPEEDMYSKLNFYTTGAKNSVFRGTLASSLDLSDAYENYVKNRIPLSLPADKSGGKRGDINLVNTDSITLVVSKDNKTGEYSVVTYGVPLKFSDVISAGKQVASALSVRNVCY